jgi:hypothetical protein
MVLLDGVLANQSAPLNCHRSEVVGGGEYRTSPGMPDIKDYKRGQSQEEIDTERSRWINSYTSGHIETYGYNE